MPGASGVVAVVREWVIRAESDFRAATHLLETSGPQLTDVICFHAQQCAEKYVKALLVSRGTDFPRTHDLEELMALLPASLRPGLTAEEQRRLTGYATAARYPGSGEFSVPEAKEAVAMARRVRGQIRRLLPRKALGQRMR